jgi:hypothetical protein
MDVLIFVGLAFLSGVLGRMGGSDEYDTKWRDVGCAAVFCLACYLFMGGAGPWWAYALTFGLHWASFSTYWDELFGYDNLWFSGCVVGFAAVPMMFVAPIFLILVPLRIVVLTVSWGCLNKYLPEKVGPWNRAVAEEFCRYAISL